MLDEAGSVIGLSFHRTQWQAVTAPIGPVLVIAGPGSGKTRCLAGRVGHLIQEHGAEPESICAITFTNKAAEEIKTRLRDALGDVVEILTLGTIHSLCLSILKVSGHRVGLADGFGVADDGHQKLILNRLRVYKGQHSNLLGKMGRRRLQGYKLADRDEDIYLNYIEMLRSQNLVDFDGILHATRQALGHEDVLEAHRVRWKHILVDEFQDLDPTQYQIIKSLAAGHRSLFAVGDDEQSIFSWRSADPRLIATFMADFGVLSPVVLNINCRCSRPIFEAAKRVLPSNELGFDKQIASHRDSGHPVRLRSSEDEDDEAAWLVRQLIDDRAADDSPWGDHAVLYRTHKDGERIEQALVAAGVPCQLSRGRSLADDPVIGQVISALRVVLSPDSWLEVERLAEAALDDVLLAEIRRMPGESVLDKARRFIPRASGDQFKNCWRFIYQVENYRSLLRNQSSARGVIDSILAQGIGRYESPLERRCDLLADPDDDEAAAGLGEMLLRTWTRRSRVYLARSSGVAFAAGEMIRKAMPNVRVGYLDAGEAGGEGDLFIHLGGPDVEPPHPGPIFRLPAAGRPRCVHVFKALQWLESRKNGRPFDEYICFDTETTGKEPDHCEVVELAAVKVRRGEVVGEYHTIVGGDRPISPGASEVHGYVDADRLGKPTLAEAWPGFREFVGDVNLVVHNGHRFDVPVIERLTAGWDGLRGMVFFDTLPMARGLIRTGGHKLTDLAALLGVDTGRSHRALDDSRCLAGVFEQLLLRWAAHARKTSLSHLLEWVAIGAAVEHIPGPCEEDMAFIGVGSRRAMMADSDALARYGEEGELSGWSAPPADVVFDRMGGRELADKVRRERSPEDRYPSAYARLASLATDTGATLAESLRSLLDTLALSRSEGVGVARDRVNLMTFHATKGLEFPHVYIIGVEDDARDMNAGDPNTMNESRRLLYVAMTRSRDRLTLTHCKRRNGRQVAGTTFLDEMGLI